MKLFHRPHKPRQRLRNSEQALPTSYAYHARRAEEEVNVGRQLERQTAAPKPGHASAAVGFVGLAS